MSALENDMNIDERACRAGMIVFPSTYFTAIKLSNLTSGSCSTFVVSFWKSQKDSMLAILQETIR